MNSWLSDLEVQRVSEPTCHMMSCDVMLCHVMLCHVMSCNVM